MMPWCESAAKFWKQIGLGPLFLALCTILLVPASVSAEKRIALTFDDIPRIQGAFFTPDERTEKLISALKQAKVDQAAFFLNPGSLLNSEGEGGEARIAAYVAAGHVIANHTNTHPALSANSVEDYVANIDDAELWLKGRPGRRPWFRFPYLDEGGTDMVKRDAVRAALAKRGLRNGYVTADGSDWFLDDLVIKARAAGKELDMEQLKRLYIAMHLSGAEYADDMARRTLGRSPAHVMLMHETDIAALFLPDMVAELRRHGWTIISVDEAYRDNLKSAQPNVDPARGDLISALAKERDIKPTGWPLWIHPGIAGTLFENRVIKKTETK
jgi:peptidoglycan-N-acetylglucosamine deacetylase